MKVLTSFLCAIEAAALCLFAACLIIALRPILKWAFHPVVLWFEWVDSRIENDFTKTVVAIAPLFGFLIGLLAFISCWVG